MTHPYTYYALKGQIRLLIPKGPFRLALALKGSLISRHAIQGFLYKTPEQSKESFESSYQWLKGLLGSYATQIDLDSGALDSPVLHCEITEVIKDRGVLKFMLRVLSVGEDYEPWLAEVAKLADSEG